MMTDSGLVRRTGQAKDLVLVVLGWVAVVASAALLPVDDLGLRRPALFLHLVAVPVSFGAVVMMNAYTVRWLLGLQSIGDLVALTAVAHQVMAGGLAALIASGIALDADLDSTLIRVKLVLVLVVMLNAARMPRSMGPLEALAPGVAGDSVPWAVLWRVMGSAVVSQLAWWGAIVLGLIATTSR